MCLCVSVREIESEGGRKQGHTVMLAREIEDKKGGSCLREESEGKEGKDKKV